MPLTRPVYARQGAALVLQVSSRKPTANAAKLVSLPLFTDRKTEAG